MITSLEAAKILSKLPLKDIIIDEGDFCNLRNDLHMYIDNNDALSDEEHDRIEEALESVTEEDFMRMCVREFHAMVSHHYYFHGFKEE